MLESALKHHQAGRLDEARRAYDEILAQEPNNFVAIHFRGVIALQEGDAQAAIKQIKRSLAIQPKYAEAHYHMGRAQQKIDQPEEAIRSYKEAIAIKADYVLAFVHLGDCYHRLGRLDEAVASYRQAIRVLPEFPLAHNNLGIALMTQGHLDEALASHKTALELQPDYADAQLCIGNVYMTQGLLEKAEQSFRKTVEIQPAHADAHNNLGIVLQELGQVDAAREQYVRAIEINPDHAVSYRHLAHIRKHSAEDDIVSSMKRVYAASGLKDDDRMHLAFGLGKAYEDLQRPDQAFEFYAKGNEIRRAQFDFSIDTEADLLDRVKRVFNKPFVDEHMAAGCPDETPIFVLGLPRSGTTLVEQILASHPAVFGAGELTNFPRLIAANFEGADGSTYPERVTGFSGSDFHRFGSQYVEEIRRLGGSAQFVTDKLPRNFIHIGMIKLSLPNAKIVHCVRNPADIGFSIFKSYFSADGNYYAYDLSEIGQYFNLYADIMAHWKDLLGADIFEIRYEDLIVDQEAQTRRLLDYCGLDWNDDCLNFHKTKRPVRTNSVGQVRQPIYASSIESWKPFERHLAPMLALLPSSV